MNQKPTSADRRRNVALLAVVVLLIGAIPALADPGDVTSSYGVDGTHTIPQTGGPHWIGAMTVRPTGEAILTGSSIGAGSGEQSFWVTEVAADGMSRQDATGIGLSAEYEFGTAITLNADGSYYVAGERGGLGGMDADVFVASFEADGDLDPSFGVVSPGVPDGVVVLAAPGTERATSLFADGSNVVVGGWRDTADFPGMITRLQQTGLPDPTFGSGGTADLTWTGFTQHDLIETAVWPTSGSNYLAIGMFSSGADAGVASMVVSSAGVGAVPQQVLAGAIDDWDSIPMSDGTVAVATQLFSVFDGSLLVITKVAPDGSVVWQTAGVPLGAFSGGVTLTELRDGSLAVAANSVDLIHRVYHYEPDGTFSGTLISATEVAALLGDSLARASGVAAIDGGLFITSVTNPMDDESVSGELGVTKYVGDDSGRFIDDDGIVHEANIEAIAALGVTLGCNPPVNDMFCPADAVTRGQMAAFLVRALGLTDDGGGGWFVDDDGSIFEADIDRLATAGITRGCNPPVNDMFCPADAVTRGQMAAFLVRALGLTDDGGGGWFVDDDGSIFEADIDRLATAGITRGCNPPVNDMFCPTDSVTRAQMATFLARALGVGS